MSQIHVRIYYDLWVFATVASTHFSIFMGICYRSKYSLKFSTLENTHRTLQGAFVTTIMDIRFRSTLLNLPVSFLNSIYFIYT